MGSIKINGTIITGNNISINNGKIIVDGKNVTPDSKEININVEGDIKELKADACSKISIGGNAGSVSTLSGDVDVSGLVNGSISTMSGDVSCGDVSGNVSTMSGKISGNIKRG